MRWSSRAVRPSAGTSFNNGRLILPSVRTVTILENPSMEIEIVKVSPDLITGGCVCANNDRPRHSIMNETMNSRVFMTGDAITATAAYTKLDVGINILGSKQRHAGIEPAASMWPVPVNLNV